MKRRCPYHGFRPKGWQLVFLFAGIAMCTPIVVTGVAAADAPAKDAKPQQQKTPDPQTKGPPGKDLQTKGLPLEHLQPKGSPFDDLPTNAPPAERQQTQGPSSGGYGGYIFYLVSTFTFLLSALAAYIGWGANRAAAESDRSVDDVRRSVNELNKSINDVDKRLRDLNGRTDKGLDVLKQAVARIRAEQLGQPHPLTAGTQPKSVAPRAATRTSDVASTPSPAISTEDLLFTIQNAADSAIADGAANDIDSLTVAVQARLPDSVRGSAGADHVRVCAHNSSAGLLADFNNPDFISISFEGKSYLLPNPRASYAHSFIKYYDGNHQNWPKFSRAAICSVDAAGKATLVDRGQL